jgi:hypothetical protein
MDLSTGCRLIEVNDPEQRAWIPVALLYPARGPELTKRFGPYALDVAQDAPPAEDDLPLVAFSHGDGGTPWVTPGRVTFLL